MVGNNYSSLENRVGGTYMSGGDHGVHGGGHGGHDAEEPENPYIAQLKKMKPYDLITFVKGHHTKGHEHHIADLDERAKALHQVYEAFEDEEVKGALTKELLKPFKKVKFKDDKYQALYKKLKKAYEDNDKDDLHHHQVEEHMKDMIDEIFADLGYGVAGNREQNYLTFQAYIQGMGEEGKKAYLNNVVENMKKGKGRAASKGIVTLLKSHQQGAYEGSVQSAIVTEDIPDFHDAYAGLLEDKLKEEIPDAQVLKGLISKNIKDYAHAAVDGRWEAIYEATKRKIKKEEHGAHGSGHGAHAAHH
ncbi:hypothetical protein HZA99_06585 [Candidatus Woesearchaeota archaeon]|nr:hypothetical protein [Candidatus Woesearchaeota archaeon]